MRKAMLVGALAALAAAAGCKKTNDGRVVIQRPGDVNVTTTQDTITLPKVDVPKVEMPHIKIHEQVDTVTTPTVETKKRVVKYPGIKVKQ